ncbi:hypothetical protein F5Y11DRAFT_169314 [Daldinia sp. FL1419]|nr:hypothetical protein F5Y11DRAFT_169314 [Daldinia sp. FL1419]
MPQIKPLLLPPTPIPNNKIKYSAVNIYHPGYGTVYLPLLRFITFHDEGVDYDLVFYAACIVAGNVWSDNPAPYLTETTDDNSPPHVTRPDDGILHGEEYFFYVPRCEDPQYPITLCFSDWVFPHNNVPQIWKDLVISKSPMEILLSSPISLREAIVFRDRSCRMTQYVTALEKAHVVPIVESDWFINNKMYQYNIDPFAKPVIDDIGNLFALRSDVHWQFDQKHFTAMPKLVDGEHKLVAHMLQKNMKFFHEQRYLFHNRPFQQLNDIPIEFLFARFAWSIFNGSTIPFFETKGYPFKVRYRPKAGSEKRGSGDPVQLIVKTISSIMALPSLREGSSSSSKQKRAQNDVTEEQHDDDANLFWSIDEGKLVNIQEIDYPFGDPDYHNPKFFDTEPDRPLKRGRYEQSPSRSPSPSTPPLS